MKAAGRNPMDPFGLIPIAVERFGLNPNDIAHIEGAVDPSSVPLLVVTLMVMPLAEPSPT